MKTLDELKDNWAHASDSSLSTQVYDQQQLENIFRSRVGKHTRASMQYFWASFILQIIVYALLAHVLVKYWPEQDLRLLSISGIALYIPFTYVLLQKFKRMAAARPGDDPGREAPLQQYVALQYDMLKKFYRFKKMYELVLIPLVSAIGVVIFFSLYVPGGVDANPVGAAIAFGITLISCVLAIRSENKKSFDGPLSRLRSILDEFDSGS